MSTPALYAVIGNPIAHSKSPAIHAAFARQTGQEIAYERILGEADSFVTQVQAFFATGGRGLNITLPFKEAAWCMATQGSQAAQLAGAANTLMRLLDGGLYADNTDGPGLIRDLTINHQVPLTAQNILLLGAGGAARGVVRALLEQTPTKLVIANRTASKALALAERLVPGAAIPTLVQAGGLDMLVKQRFDIIINATSAGIEGQVPPIPKDCLIPGGVAYDMLYADKPTPFVRWGRNHGARLATDGLGMLVEQAAESFYLWRGIRPNTVAVLQAMRQSD